MAVWRGVDPSSTVSFGQGRGMLESYLGRGLTQADLTNAQNHFGGSPINESSSWSGGDWNSLLQAGAQMYGGSFEAWGQPPPPPQVQTGGGPGTPPPVGMQTGGGPGTPPGVQMQNPHPDGFNQIQPPWPAPAPGGASPPPSYQNYYSGLNLPPPLVAPDPFSYAAFDPGDPFSYAAFEAPDAEAVFRDPSYKFRLGQGTGAIEASAAARGMTRTGQTLKGLNDYAQQFASQEYGNVHARAADQYKTDYGVASDTFDRNYDNRWDEYTTGYNQSADTYDRNWGTKTAVYDRDVDAATLRDRAARDDRAFDFGRTVWEDERAYRDRTYLSGENRWQQEFQQRENEWRSSDQFRRAVQGTEDEYRRVRDSVNDAWRLRVLEEERLRFLAELGAR